MSKPTFRAYFQVMELGPTSSISTMIALVVGTTNEELAQKAFSEAKNKMIKPGQLVALNSIVRVGKPDLDIWKDQEDWTIFADGHAEPQVVPF